MTEMRNAEGPGPDAWDTVPQIWKHLGLLLHATRVRRRAALIGRIGRGGEFAYFVTSAVCLVDLRNILGASLNIVVKRSEK